MKSFKVGVISKLTDARYTKVLWVLLSIAALAIAGGAPTGPGGSGGGRVLLRAHRGACLGSLAGGRAGELDVEGHVRAAHVQFQAVSARLDKSPRHIQPTVHPFIARICNISQNN